MRVSGGGSKEDLGELLILEEFIALGLVRISLKTARRQILSITPNTHKTNNANKSPLLCALACSSLKSISGDLF